LEEQQAKTREKKLAALKGSKELETAEKERVSLEKAQRADADSSARREALFAQSEQVAAQQREKHISKLSENERKLAVEREERARTVNAALDEIGQTKEQQAAAQKRAMARKEEEANAMGAALHAKHLDWHTMSQAQRAAAEAAYMKHAAEEADKRDKERIANDSATVAALQEGRGGELNSDLKGAAAVDNRDGFANKASSFKQQEKDNVEAHAREKREFAERSAQRNAVGAKRTQENQKAGGGLPPPPPKPASKAAPVAEVEYEEVVEYVEGGEGEGGEGDEGEVEYVEEVVEVTDDEA